MSIGISAPEYRQVDRSGAIYSYAGYFTQNGYINGGKPIGLIQNVHGRKNAKEECAKAVLRFLEDYVAELKMETS
jgi:hypothetical protein